MVLTQKGILFDVGELERFAKLCPGVKLAPLIRELFRTYLADVEGTKISFDDGQLELFAKLCPGVELADLMPNLLNRYLHEIEE